MDLDLNCLDQAFQAVANVGKGELTFEFNGSMITLRVLLPHENRDVQLFADEARRKPKVVVSVKGKDAPEEPENNLLIMTNYYYRFRVALLSYALVQIDSTDFRDAEFIAIGKKLENGNSIKIPKHQALRDMILKKWTDTAVSALNKKYTELLARVEKEAAAAVVFEPSDLETELEEARARVKELEDEKASEEKALRGTEPEPEVETDAVAPPVVPTVAVAPPVIPQTVAPPSMPRPLPTEHVAPPVQAPVIPPQSEVISSFVDSDDTEGMVKAAAAEGERLARARAIRMMEVRNAANRADAVPTASLKPAAEIVPKAAPAMTGTLAGVPVFTMGNAQELNSKGSRKDPRAPVIVNTPVPGGTNPKFRGPQRP